MADEQAPVVPAATGTPTSSPTPIELSDDSFVKLPGSDKPVKWGEHYRGFQSEFTKKAQAAKASEVERQKLAGQLKEYEQRFQAMQARIQQAAGGQAQPNDPYADLKARNYLDGDSAYKLAGQLRNEFSGFGQELSKRDQILLALAQELKSQRDQVSGFQRQRAEADFEGYISKTISDNNIGPEWSDFAKEMYLGYNEDETLRSEFPKMLKTRVEQIESATRSADKKRAQAARSLPFVPGKGAQGSGGKPLSLAGKSTQELADLLWPGGDGAEDT